MNTKQIGNLGEDHAVRIYERNNFCIVLRNFFNHIGKQFGEIDFIAQRGHDLHFVEIKTRSSNAYGHALESITFRKRFRLIKTARYFLANVFDSESLSVHFDLAVVRICPFDKHVETITIYSDVIEDI